MRSISHWGRVINNSWKSIFGSVFVMFRLPPMQMVADDLSAAPSEPASERHRNLAAPSCFYAQCLILDVCVSVCVGFVFVRFVRFVLFAFLFVASQPVSQSPALPALASAATHSHSHSPARRPSPCRIVGPPTHRTAAAHAARCRSPEPDHTDPLGHAAPLRSPPFR